MPIENLIDKDIRSRKVAFVSHCLLNQNVKAAGTVEVHGAIAKEVVCMLAERDIGLEQMACPEMIWGIDRMPDDPREATPAFRQHCRQKAEQAARHIRDFEKAGHKVVCIIGVKGSPTCGVEKTHVAGKPFDKPGMFMDELMKLVGLPFIEFRRKDWDYSKKQLESVLDA